MVGRLGALLLVLACGAAQAESRRVFLDSWYSEDSDEQQITRAAAGFRQTLTGAGGESQWSVRAGHHRLEAPAGREDFSQLQLDWETGKKASLGGALRLNQMDGEAWSPLLGAASLHWKPANDWYLETSFEREMVDTVIAVRNRTRLDTGALSLDWSFAPQWTLVAGASGSRFSDGNDRNGRIFRLIWSPPQWSAFNLQLRTRRADSDATGVGYFNPRRLEEAELIARLAGSTRDEQWNLSLLLGGGQQRVNGGDSNPIYQADLRIRGWFTPHYGAEFQALCTNTGSLASSAAEGYRYCQGRLAAIYAW